MKKKLRPAPRQPAVESLIVRVERIVPDGYGIGFADNLTVFVPLAAPGDLVTVRVKKLKGKVAFAEITEILESSPDRIKPPCPVFGSCGGCDFQQLNYAAQLRAKVAIVRDCLRRIGKIDWQKEIEIVPSPNEWNYRTRAQWKRDGRKLGYFERGSHRVCDVEVCPILSPALQREMNLWREKISGSYVNFGEIQAVSSDGSVSWRFAEDAPDFDENFYAANKIAEIENIAAPNSPGFTEADEISLTIGDFEYSFSADAFFQVNHEILPQVLASAVGLARGETALDLYCGVGLFSLPLAQKFKRVYGVEGSAASINFAHQNARRAAVSNIDFTTAWVGEWLAENAEKIENPDFVLLDPPRTGAERETIEILTRLKPQKIVYVSCNPATLARDLRILLDSNAYQIESVTAFDFFPQTHHVETVVKLTLLN